MRSSPARFAASASSLRSLSPNRPSPEFVRPRRVAEFPMTTHRIALANLRCPATPDASIAATPTPLRRPRRAAPQPAVLCRVLCSRLSRSEQAAAGQRVGDPPRAQWPESLSRRTRTRDHLRHGDFPTAIRGFGSQRSVSQIRISWELSLCHRITTDRENRRSNHYNQFRSTD